MSISYERVRAHWQLVASCLRKTRTRLDRFAADRSGNIAMMFGFSVIPLMVAIGGAADIARWLHARDQTAAAIDAAVLAGAGVLRMDSYDTAGAVTVANKFYEENIRTRLKVKSDAIAFEVADDGTAVSASGQAYIETPFLHLAGINKLPLLNVASSKFSKGAVAAGDNAGKNLEVSIMIDLSQSLDDQKLSDLKEATKDVIDIVIWNDQSTHYSKVALAPFSDAVRPGALYLEQVRGTPPSTHRFKDKGKWHDYELTDCVSERGGNGAYTDIAPFGNDLLGPVYTEDGKCNPSSEVVPLTSDKDYLKTKIDEMQANGWTAGHLGTAWAWYLISPNWSDIWPSESTPASYDNPDVKKVVILMSDGEYNQQYDAAGVAIREEGRGDGAKNGLSDAQARQICDNIQETGTTVYTIGFELEEKKAIETMRRCATTTENFYLAQSGEQLKQALRDIAIKLTPLYLSQ